MGGIKGRKQRARLLRRIAAFSPMKGFKKPGSNKK